MSLSLSHTLSLSTQNIDKPYQAWESGLAPLTGLRRILLDNTIIINEFQKLTLATWKCSGFSVSTISWSCRCCCETEDRRPSNTPLKVNFFIFSDFCSQPSTGELVRLQAFPCFKNKPTDNLNTGSAYQAQQVPMQRTFEGQTKFLVTGGNKCQIWQQEWEEWTDYR